VEVEEPKKPSCTPLRGGGVLTVCAVLWASINNCSVCKQSTTYSK
jgi:hypothetical protein